MFTKKAEPTAFDVPRGVPPPAPQPQSHQSEPSAPSHQARAIEQGAFFEGKSRRVADPMSGVSTPETPGPAGPGFPLRSES